MRSKLSREPLPYMHQTVLSSGDNTALEILECGRNPITNLDVTNCINLTNLDLSAYCSYPGCWGGTIETLDISKNVSLKELHCGGNLLTVLDVSN